MWYLRPKSAGVAKFEERWERGIWLGSRDESGEAIVGADDGILKVRSIRRKGEMIERWDKTQLGTMRGVPWKPIPDSEETELRASVNVPIVTSGPTIPAMTEPEMGVRRMRITKEMIIKFGYLPGCQGCKKVAQGKIARDHTEECRKIIEDKLRDEGNATIARADERINEQFAQRLADEVEKETKRRRIEEPNSNFQEGGASSSGTIQPTGNWEALPEKTKNSRKAETQLDEDEDRAHKFTQVEE